MLILTNPDDLDQDPATHGITGATSGGSRAAKYNIISFFLNFMTIKMIIEKFYTRLTTLFNPKNFSRSLPACISELI